MGSATPEPPMPDPPAPEPPGFADLPPGLQFPGRLKVASEVAILAEPLSMRDAEALLCKFNSSLWASVVTCTYGCGETSSVTPASGYLARTG